MTHSEKRASAFVEAKLALFTGSIYGATHTFTGELKLHHVVTHHLKLLSHLSGHPLDTIKSKMQIQTGYTHRGSWGVAMKIYSTDGVRGFFRGCVPPLWGSMIYRGIMMSSYEFAYTYFDKHFEDSHAIKTELGPTGLRPMVPLSSLFASMCRGVVESKLY